MVRVTCIASLLIGTIAVCAQPPAKLPNVVVIVADDLSWADLGCYGNAKIETPHLNRLASQGMRFTNAYAPAPICSASRAALLTGKSPARLHFEFVTKPDNSEVPPATPLKQPDYPRDLPLDELTLAELVAPAYRTGFFGKWHLTQENDRYLGWGETFGPLQQGFHFGSENRGSHPYGYTKQEEKSFGTYAPGEYPIDSLTESATAFIRDNADSPFLLYYSLYYVHTPVKTRSRWLYDKYRAKYGPDASENVVQYGAFVETMDAYVGRLLKELDEHQLRENTIVMFVSDNGGHPQFTDNGPLRGSKWNLYEGGIRTPMIIRWPGVVNENSTCEVPVIGTDLFATVSAITSSKRAVAGDGMSLLPLLRDPESRALNERALYWHFPFYHPMFVNTKPQSSIRQGNYKLIYFYEDKRSELYDLGKDMGEQVDLSRKVIHRTHKLREKLFTHLRSVNARFPY